MRKNACFERTKIVEEKESNPIKIQLINSNNTANK